MSVLSSAWAFADSAAASSGVVTFLFTDVEGSTVGGQADADAMRVALAAHDEVLRGAIKAHGATASPTSQPPVVTAMTSNGKAYEIADCFWCTARPGIWETDGPAMANRPRTWSRRSDLTGDLSGIIDTGVVKSGQRERVALKLGE